MVDPLLDNLPLLLTVSGIVLVIMEALAPGAHLIVVGVALLAAGLAGLLFSPLAAPLVLAVLVTAFGAAALFVYREFDFYGGKGMAQTSDSDSLSGKTGRVVERVTDSSGRVKLVGGGFNPYFEARAFDEPIEEGASIIVVDPGGGNVVTVAATGDLETDKLDRELERASDEAEAETETDADSDPAGGS
jgi:membrane protein implicated in regulation of membrane protease activity